MDEILSRGSFVFKLFVFARRVSLSYLLRPFALHAPKRRGKDSKGHSMLTLLPALLLASPGANNGTCEPWCKWIPVPVQPLVPLCAGCNEQSSKRGLDGEETYADGGCANWCQWVPVPMQPLVPECEACDGAEKQAGDCAGWCKWVPVPVQPTVPGCQGCGDAVAGPQALALA